MFQWSYTLVLIVVKATNDPFWTKNSGTWKKLGSTLMLREIYDFTVIKWEVDEFVRRCCWLCVVILRTIESIWACKCYRKLQFWLPGVKCYHRKMNFSQDWTVSYLFNIAGGHCKNRACSCSTLGHLVFQ
jgi:hypothetical protein